ncbi:hypothetical protein [Edaphobacter albus]|uniref:hypothetical protein n=1 Tax=Edaphobacter sp. 4G125 TaxID=2763071 RepID=UPI0016469337|nr:hypothetical protein [Edaphobacter sp. 4G125]QNI37502.1 hypothetical protein H7846_04150 [Edaphobacter sp. 4G125]
MAGLNVSKWQAARRKQFYDPAMQFFLRMIRTALDEAKAVKGVACPYVGGWYANGSPMEFAVANKVFKLSDWQSWDDAIMARHWIARETPDRHLDPCGYLLSFEHCCELLSLNPDYEATWMLREIDECADFDTEEVHTRIEFLTNNPPDDVEEELFEGFRVVAKVDQMSMFGGMAA